MNKRNSQNLIFKLGDERVNERVNYDHVGVRVCLYDDDVSGLEERVSKARRAFYAISGLGIRRCGLNMYTCNVILWSIIAPITMYGCELLCLDDKSISFLEKF